LGSVKLAEFFQHLFAVKVSSAEDETLEKRTMRRSWSGRKKEV